MSAIAADGNLVLAVLVAMAAGVVSFASPCVLPLVPGFLGYVTGLSGEVAGSRDGQENKRGSVPETPLRRPPSARVIIGAALFVAGFSVVFLAGTVLASAVGSFLVEYRRAVSTVGGLVVIALAFVFLGWGTQGSWSPRWRPAAGLAGAPLLGMVFAVGWAPCMGPTLAVIYTLATTTGGGPGTILRGCLLGAAYCGGLGVPFLLVAAGWARATAASSWLRRHHVLVQRCGGGLLLAVGVLLLTGWWDSLVVFLQIRLINGFIPSL
ncbi:cytochrome c biogenesis CcdA family protein [Austwickia chelonae]|uniref:cytochrome c biogenesis CcdA family protein n=1 Tax=Austwickia chelonae TaxID=100225 RepID=UPI000E252360|nr:cytochrome c biogenesis CcdA family protein [Austwickia chelonae]